MTAGVLEAPRRAAVANPGGRRMTLEERLEGAWRMLHVEGEADCPVCGSQMTLREDAGECGGCGARMT